MTSNWEKLFRPLQRNFRECAPASVMKLLCGRCTVHDTADVASGRHGLLANDYIGRSADIRPIADQG